MKASQYPRKTISKWSLLRWLEPEIAFGETFWPEVFSALTMLFPALHGYYMAPDIAADASFPPGVWVLLYATLFHCPVSMAYHLANAAFYGMSGYDALNTPFRTADLVAIHLCCIAFGWAESHGDISYTIFLIVINVGCILSLLHTLALGRRGGRHENYWVAFAVFLYTLPVLMRCDYINYVGPMASRFLLAAAGAVMLACCLQAAFVVLPGAQAPALRGARTQGDASFSSLGMTSVAATTAAFGVAAAVARSRKREAKTAAKYTTQTILPSLAWIKTGVKASELKNTELKALTLAGNDVLIGKTEAGALFCVGNLCPHIGTPMSEGADVIGDVIVCPLHGSSFKVTNGELIDWCVSPPIIGPLTGLIVEKKNLLVFECRQGGFLGSGEVEVLVDTNAKKAYEANYWKGLLDAQGKDDGTYY